MSKDLSRRDVLRISGLAAAAVAVKGLPMPNLSTPLQTNYSYEPHLLVGTGGFPDDSVSTIGWFDRDGFTLGGTNYQLGWANAGTLQWGITSDGTITWGGGAVVGDADGITFQSVSAYGNPNTIKWKTTDDLLISGSIYGFVTGTTPDRSGYTKIYATAETGGNGNAYIEIGTERNNSINAFNTFRINDESSFFFPIFMYTDRYGNSGSFHYGDYIKAFSFAITTTPGTAMVTKTVKANSLGTKGWIKSEAWCTLFNNSAGSRIYSALYEFGSYSVTITASAAQTASGTARGFLHVTAWSWNDQANNAQVHIFHFVRRAGTAAANFAAATDDFWGWDTSAVSTASDITVDWKLYSAAATATQTAVGAGMIIGPYYGA